jgi:hypothetical protein
VLLVTELAELDLTDLRRLRRLDCFNVPVGDLEVPLLKALVSKRALETLLVFAGLSGSAIAWALDTGTNGNKVC